MIGKNWEIVQYYKDMLIYYKTNKYNQKILYFGNRQFNSQRPRSIRSAKILITRYINKLSAREKKRLKYLKY
jgi:hypothetical protein